MTMSSVAEGAPGGDVAGRGEHHDDCQLDEAEHRVARPGEIQSPLSARRRSS